MKTGIGCMLGPDNVTGKYRKQGVKSQKHQRTCAHIFWDFMLNMVRNGQLCLKELMAAAMGALKSCDGSSECGGTEGCGGRTPEGYTGNSPPEVSVAVVESMLQPVMSKLNVKLKALGLGTMLAAGTIFSGCKKDPEPTPNPPTPVKTDVRIGWNIVKTPVCENSEANMYRKVLNEKIVDSLLALPTTGKIIAYVYCEDGRGPPKAAWTIITNELTAIKEKGVIFEPGTIYVGDELQSNLDTVGIKQALNLSIKKWSEREM